MNRWQCACLALPFLAAATFAAAQPEQQSVMIHGYPMYTALDFDAIPAIDDPVFVSTSEADSFLYPDEMVIGVLAGGEARAYSIWHLDFHEIVNDVIG